MADLLTELRAACAAVAERATHVRVQRGLIPSYAATLPLGSPQAPADPEAHVSDGNREQLAAFWLTLDAINFGSGWFPTLRKRQHSSGYFTIADGLRDRFAARGAWSAEQLAMITAGEMAEVLGQDQEHELMGLFAASLNDLGARLAQQSGGSFTALVDEAGGSAVALVGRLGAWGCFADSSSYGELRVPFLKRAQIAAADLARTRVLAAADLDRLTMFADNLVPHVLRLDGILSLDSSLRERIERGELIEHDSAEEVEIRACALHAVELIVAARPGSLASEVDQLLWHRGQSASYKSRPRHRCRCTAY
jgi:hypothetical protein